MSKTAFAVWESEYPDDGCTVIVAASEYGARRKYRRMTRERASSVTELVPLVVFVITAAEALALVRNAQ